ncbi:MAG: hypothetical protein Q9M28_08230 [Mariprofundaceae bacterium]|nr:hypothetical protein [Mariprofundaceae bacterium]
MKEANSIKASLNTSFRGETHNASLDIDLDRFMLRNEDFSLLHAQLAQSIGLDSYSHLYDVMCSEAIFFSHAAGMAKDYLEAESFDFDAFAEAWKEEQVFHAIQEVAKQCMAIDDLSQHPELRQALSQAFQKGREMPQQVIKHNIQRF